ncbi:MAG: hypothetical protein PHF46_04740 [Candidatus Gracilibacteria bacterium]|nr:hypothetical protein [Candidatus Gracilibacteria bacterium]MDD3120687.1 hypothetical protein [Candidatus Gracilibacteria bacterium]MDD4530052.1 hypothetical protein [Candidatus Gracilibacteria bacterium]
MEKEKKEDIFQNEEQFIKQAYRVESALCYIPLGFLFPYIQQIEETPFLAFHRKQGIVAFALFMITLILSFFIPFIGGFIRFLNFIFYFFIIIFGMYFAINSKEVKIPIIGNIVDILDKNTEE